MRKDQVDAAGVQIDRRAAQQAKRHRRAFEMPARPSRSDAVVPRRLPGLRCLPQHEIPSIVFRVVVAVDAAAGARLDALAIQVRELPVRREGRDPEVDGAIADVGVSARRRAPRPDRTSRAGWPRRLRAASLPAARGRAPPRLRGTRRCTDRCTREAACRPRWRRQSCDRRRR